MNLVAMVSVMCGHGWFLINERPIPDDHIAKKPYYENNVERDKKQGEQMVGLTW